MRILVTGGAGYVGSVSVERFLEAGHDVVVVDDLSSGHANAVPDGARLVTESYANVPAIVELLGHEQIDAILHCGAKSLVGESVREPAAYYRANVVGGVGLLEAARDAGVRRFVFSSTAAVYGVPGVTPITEDTPPAPINPYGETKRTFEGALRWFGKAYGLRSVALRYFNVAGASERNGELHDPETHLIPNVLRAAEGEAELTVFGTDYPTPDGTCVRDYIHVADLADAHLLALEATDPSDARTGAPDVGGLEVVNLGNGGGFSVLQVLDAAEAVVGREIPCTIGPRRPGDPPVLVASSARAEAVLGWRPARPTLEEMIGSAWEWRRRNVPLRVE
ncbi:MAG TPA: UDP-glucose 4-epimerase GalE [Candidatus Limnocylindrales bacterium]